MIHLTQPEYESLVAARKERDRLLQMPTGDQVSISLTLLDTIYCTLNYYASVTTYQAPRIGGVLAGCPRGAKPMPDDLIREAREAIELLDAWNAARRQEGAAS